MKNYRVFVIRTLGSSRDLVLTSDKKEPKMKTWNELSLGNKIMAVVSTVAAVGLALFVFTWKRC